MERTLVLGVCKEQTGPPPKKLLGPEEKESRMEEESKKGRAWGPEISKGPPITVEKKNWEKEGKAIFVRGSPCNCVASFKKISATEKDRGSPQFGEFKPALYSL